MALLTGADMSDCLGCSYIETHSVTLRNGTTVCTSCPAWREECEVRAVANMLTDADRKSFLSKVSDLRGKEAAQELRAKVLELMREKK